MIKALGELVTLPTCKVRLDSKMAVLQQPSETAVAFRFTGFTALMKKSLAAVSLTPISATSTFHLP